MQVTAKGWDRFRFRFVILIDFSVAAKPKARPERRSSTSPATTAATSARLTVGANPTAPPDSATRCQRVTTATPNALSDAQVPPGPTLRRVVASGPGS